jgi:hypothetical protein
MVLIVMIALKVELDEEGSDTTRTCLYGPDRLAIEIRGKMGDIPTIIARVNGALQALQNASAAIAEVICARVELAVQ